MSKIIFNLILLIILKIIISDPNCQEGQNLCNKCHPITKLCSKCEKDIYIPDENGGCEYSRTCIKGNHHCFECNQEGKLCEKCEEGYFPDGNGGCSYTNYCEISFEGKCLECKENFILVGKTDYYAPSNEIKICKSLNSEDLINCEKIDLEKGICQECKNGYYLGNSDRKCTLTPNCYESTFGICSKCRYGFYLDKKEQKCKKQENVFEHCRESLDGISCEVCDEDYYFDEEGNCCATNYCALREDYNKCQKCINGYYLSSYGDCCTQEKNCYHGNKDLGICTSCLDNYCIDFSDGKCKSNLENNDLKYCKVADGFCISCEYGYYLGKDNKCSTSKYCSESDDGICVVCEENYFFGFDNKCTNIENCIIFNDNNECVECVKNYYYNKNGNNCILAEGIFENCKTGNENEKCEKCRDDFYLSRKDYLCHSNSEEGPFHRCAFSDSNEEKCTECIDGYYLGYYDDKCSSIDGCDLSENENKCLECDEHYVLNLKDNRCYPNDEIKDEEKKYYFNCLKTNEEGDRCEVCRGDSFLTKNGLCKDEFHCSYKEGDVCKKCSGDYFSYCLNNIFGCVEIFHDNCFECDEILDFDKCTKCEDGFDLNEFSQCERVD